MELRSSDKTKTTRLAKGSGHSTPDLKVVIVGASDVGKTCFLLRYMEKKFTSTASTIGATFLLKQWQNRSIAIWDTAGEERYCGLSSLYFRSAGAAILAFDLTREETFDTLRNRFVPMLENTPNNCLIVVVGTKLDLIQSASRKFPATLGESLVKSLNHQLDESAEVPYFETSSLTGQNVDKVFDYIFEYSFPKSKDGKCKSLNKHNLNSNIYLNTTAKKPILSCCNT